MRNDPSPKLKAGPARTRRTNSDIMTPRPLPKLCSDTLRVLRSHRPGVAAYLSWAFGPIASPSGLVPVDRVYGELVARGLVVAGQTLLTVLPGELRFPFVLTAEGDRVRCLWSASKT
jgi:hypothetical protein